MSTKLSLLDFCSTTIAKVRRPRALKDVEVAMDFRDRREDSRLEAAEIFKVGTGMITSEAVVEEGRSNVVSLDHVDLRVMKTYVI